MDNMAGPSNANSTVFASEITTNVSSGRNLSYYSNIEPDFKWMRMSVKHLIYLVSVHFDEFYDKTLKKKVLWKKIAEEMRNAGYYCTSDDCDKKWRNIKKSYVSVLQKQVQGDFSSKFPYFDEMHSFLGKEIDPLGMREQGLNKAIQENTLPSSVEFPRIPFYEVVEDDHFLWSDSAVYLLLDAILEHEKIFRINSDIDSVWESIRNKMVNEGYDILPEQCQRKWVNLSDGFRHHQAEAELTGIHPKWNFFARVRKVINTLNVPVTIIQDSSLNVSNLKGSLTTPIIMREPPHKKRKRRREMVEKDSEDDDDDDDYSHEDTPNKFHAALRRLQGALKADDRLSHLEARIEVAHKVRAESKQSITVLENILGKLRHINRSFELRKEQLLKEHEEEVERLKHERLILNHVDGSTNIVDEAACRQAFLNMQDLANFQFMKAPKVELVEGTENDGIIIVEGLS